MIATEIFQDWLTYSDEMNRRMMHASSPLSAEQLDRSFDLGLGSLRKILAHILVGEQVWLERCRGNVEAQWPPYATSKTPTEMLGELEQLILERQRFFVTLDGTQLAAEQQYRDSKGSLFVATLHDMFLQTLTHSTHHRAQAVHLLRQVGGEFVEMDFMCWRRRTLD